ncbi:CST complex subunit STN1-like isoform X2 [Oscarella lobularis]|uniref:CST complex subunit STN1-like isoform X2 n=1 Tax=Oscarella lobularis TaxID=121494 RepID=UPI0033143064
MLCRLYSALGRFVFIFMSLSPLYPPRFWGLDKLYWSYVKLNCADVLEIPEYPKYSGCYCVGNHPIVRVELMGDVVRLHRKTKNLVFDLDDGTGICSCCYWLRGDEEEEDNDTVKLKLGQLVTVRGKITVYRGQRQLTAAAVCILTCSLYLSLLREINCFVPYLVLSGVERDVHAECRRWVELIHLKATVYKKPFMPPKEALEGKHGKLDSLRQSDNDPVSVTREAILDYLNGREASTFLFKDLKEEPVVVFAIRHTLQLKEDNFLAHDKICQLLRKALMLMAEDGQVYLSNLIEDRYEVLNFRVVTPIVLRIITELQKDDGIHLESIVSSLHASRSKLAKVQRSVVKESLEQLVADSDIYEVSHRRYKAVD